MEHDPKCHCLECNRKMVGIMIANKFKSKFAAALCTDCNHHEVFHKNTPMAFALKDYCCECEGFTQEVDKDEVN